MRTTYFITEALEYSIPSTSLVAKQSFWVVGRQLMSVYCYCKTRNGTCILTFFILVLIVFCWCT